METYSQVVIAITYKLHGKNGETDREISNDQLFISTSAPLIKVRAGRQLFN